MEIIEINKILNQNAMKYGAKTAVNDGSYVITYNELDKNTNSLAHFLVKNNVNKGDRVCIFLNNCTSYILSIFAIIKIAAIYVPIHRDAPKDRIEKIINDCKPKVIITDNDKLSELMSIDCLDELECIITVDSKQLEAPYNGKGIKVVSISKCLEESSDFIQQKQDIDDIAYIIYTSGSTGAPKGVAITYRGLNNYLNDFISYFNLSEESKVLCIFPFYFDGSIGNIFSPMIVGGTIFIYNSKTIIPRKLTSNIISNEISYMGMTPIIFKLFVENLTDSQCNLLKLKVITIGGDVFPLEHVKRLKLLKPDLRIINRYGPTETSVAVSSYEVNETDLLSSSEVPIGRPATNVNFYVLDDNCIECDVGKVGELYIGGIQVMKGYWNDNSLTNEVIFEDVIKGDRIYRTGDLVYKDEKGFYYFKGRNDDMIKRHGNRIFLSEIENNIQSLEYIKDCICFFVKEDEYENIISFIVLIDDVSIDTIKEDLGTKVPFYMIPDVIKFIDEIPHTQVGKKDRKKARIIYDEMVK